MENILIQSLRLISPQAGEFVAEYGCRTIWSAVVEGQPSCVVEANLDKMGLVYAALTDAAPKYARDLVLNALQDLIHNQAYAEKCFNCRCDDLQSRSLALGLGFKLDMAGYQLCRTRAADALDVPYILQPYTDSELEDWILLLREAYHQLCLDNSWDTDCGIRDREQFGQMMQQRSSRNEVYSCYYQGKLVGGFRLSGAFIEDMAVLPEYQNRGIGSFLLNSATMMLLERAYPMVQLRVAESNQAALRLYQRYHFTICGRFAEHSFLF